MVYLLDLPVLEYGNVGRIGQIAFRTVWIKEMMRRQGLESPSDTWAFLYGRIAAIFLAAVGQSVFRGGAKFLGFHSFWSKKQRSGANVCIHYPSTHTNLL